MFDRVVFVWSFISLTFAGIGVAESPNAWLTLLRDNPTSAGQMNSLERRVLQLMTLDQLEKYRDGATASEIILSNGLTLHEFMQSKGAGFAVNWYSIDGGGGLQSTGPGFALSGTIGQPEAATSTGGTFSLTGGFWAIRSDSSKVFCDGFESGSADQWSNTTLFEGEGS